MRMKNLQQKNERNAYKYETSVFRSISAILLDCERISTRFNGNGESKRRRLWSEAPQKTGSEGNGKHEATSEWTVFAMLIPRWSVSASAAVTASEVIGGIID